MSGSGADHTASTDTRAICDLIEAIVLEGDCGRNARCFIESHPTRGGACTVPMHPDRAPVMFDGALRDPGPLDGTCSADQGLTVRGRIRSAEDPSPRSTAQRARRRAT